MTEVKLPELVITSQAVVCDILDLPCFSLMKKHQMLFQRSRVFNDLLGGFYRTPKPGL